MRPSRLAAAALVVASSIATARAADFDGSTPFVCALLELTSCAVGSDCERETPQSANVPRFLFVDAKQNSISGTRPDGKTLATKIEHQRMLGDFLVLEGAEGALSWTVSVDKTSGHMSLGAVGDQVGFVVFGECAKGAQN